MAGQWKRHALHGIWRGVWLGRRAAAVIHMTYPASLVAIYAGAFILYMLCCFLYDMCMCIHCSTMVLLLSQHSTNNISLLSAGCLHIFACHSGARRATSPAYAYVAGLIYAFSWRKSSGISGWRCGCSVRGGWRRESPAGTGEPNSEKRR